MAGEYIKIGSGDEPIVFEDPDKGLTEGIGPCMAVGILNRRTRRGYLGHYVNWDTSSKALVDKAVGEAGNIGDLEVALAGNVPPSEDEVEAWGDNFENVLAVYRSHGRWALQMVRSMGINPRRIQNYLQTDPSRDSYEMVVDTETGKIEVNKE